MLNRRYIRIKVFQAVYSFAQQENISLESIRKLYQGNISKLQQAYLKILSLPVELKHFATIELDKHQQRNFTDAKRMESYKVLSQNLTIEKIAADPGFAKSLQKSGETWQQEWDSFHTLFDEIEQLPSYNLQRSAEPNMEADKALLKNILVFLFDKSTVFDSLMEDSFIGWQEDKPVLLKNLGKTIDQITENEPLKLYHLPNAEWKEIQEFGAELLEKTIGNFDEFEELIAGKTLNWDSDRIALTDSIFMKMAIAEFMFFETIPIKVTINEYLELAKVYSTPKSNSFLNGVLDNLQKEMKEQGKIVKTGRGLIG
ncbi:MAG: transcription antitermination protein NusB [Bacteroidota bacterium]|nr:transcription antitermination protein NusB [Bacteroidota bacterium]